MLGKIKAIPLHGAWLVISPQCSFFSAAGFSMAGIRAQWLEGLGSRSPGNEVAMWLVSGAAVAGVPATWAGAGKFDGSLVAHDREPATHGGVVEAGAG